MKIAILTSGILPIPAVQGGAVENLIDFYLEYNSKHRLHDITVYSVSNPKTKNRKELKSDVNHYHYIDITSFFSRVKRRFFYWINGEDRFNYFIEYYAHLSIQHILKQQYDIIIMENRPEYALKLVGNTSAKLIYHLHNEKLTTQTRDYEIIYNAAFRIISVSDYITNCVKAINSKDSKCITIHNGIDLNTFNKEHYTKKNIRSSLNLSDNDFVLVFCGRINPEKGILDLIEALLLLKTYKNIKLLVIGGSFFGNANSDDEFIRILKTKSIPIKNRILFTGFIPYEQIPEYLSIADVAVIPSIWNDPFPTTVLEAQAMGLPIITTRRGGIPEEVTESNAILLETDSSFVTKLSDSIIKLYSNPNLCGEMTKFALINAKKFEKDLYARNFFNALI